MILKIDKRSIVVMNRVYRRHHRFSYSLRVHGIVQLEPMVVGHALVLRKRKFLSPFRDFGDLKRLILGFLDLCGDLLVEPSATW